MTNPLALAVAQPLVGVPLFRRRAARAVFVFLTIGILYLLRYVRSTGYRAGQTAAGHAAHAAAKLSLRHKARHWSCSPRRSRC